MPNTLKSTRLCGLKSLLLLAVMFSSACVMLSQEKQADLTKTMWAYQSAIRWGRYETALRLQKTPQDDFDFSSLRDVKISSYKSIHQKVSEDGDQVEQTVEIRYYRESSIVEKTIIDKQIWVYHDSNWLLDGKLPRFE